MRARLGEHLGGHVDTDDGAGRGDGVRGDERVEAGARTDVDDPFAGFECADRERVADAGERLDGHVGERVDDFGVVAEFGGEATAGVEVVLGVGSTATARYLSRTSARSVSTSTGRPCVSVMVRLLVRSAVAGSGCVGVGWWVSYMRTRDDDAGRGGERGDGPDRGAHAERVGDDAGEQRADRRSRRRARGGRCRPLRRATRGARRHRSRRAAWGRPSRCRRRGAPRRAPTSRSSLLAAMSPIAAAWTHMPPAMSHLRPTRSDRRR